MLHHFERFGNPADLHQAITFLEELVRSTLVWDHQYLIGIANLGVALCYRFKRFGDLGDLEEAISRHRVKQPTSTVNASYCYGRSKASRARVRQVAQGN